MESTNASLDFNAFDMYNAIVPVENYLTTGITSVAENTGNTTVEISLFTEYMINSTDSEHVEYLTMVIAHYVQLVVPITLVVIGSIGNTVSFLVFYTDEFKHSVTALYFRCLAVSDTLVLWIGLLPDFLNFHFGVKPESTAACKVVNYARLVVFDSSVYTLMLVTLERCVCVWLPHRVKVIYNKRRAAVSVILVYVTMLFRNIYYPIMLEYININGFYVCYVTEEYMYFFTNIEIFLSMAISLFLPAIFIFFANMTILINVYLANKRRSQLRVGKESSLNMAGMTVHLLTVSLVFIVLNTPDLVAQLQQNFYAMVPDAGPSGARLYLWYTIARYLAATNYAINFFLYCLSGRLFRNQMKHLFCQKST